VAIAIFGQPGTDKKNSANARQAGASERRGGDSAAWMEGVGGGLKLSRADAISLGSRMLIPESRAIYPELGLVEFRLDAMYNARH
jgi:hypothetical protein